MKKPLSIDEMMLLYQYRQLQTKQDVKFFAIRRFLMTGRTALTQAVQSGVIAHLVKRK